MVVRHGSAGSGKTKAGSDPVERRLSLLILLYSSSTKRTSFTLEHYVHLGLRERLTDRSPVTKSPLPVLPFRLVARPSGINLKKSYLDVTPSPLTPFRYSQDEVEF